MSAAGAPIDELNTVRKQLSQIKGGGLARACSAGRLVTLVISDVLGDPLGSDRLGPDGRRILRRRQDALRMLEQYDARAGRHFRASVRRCSQRASKRAIAAPSLPGVQPRDRQQRRGGGGRGARRPSSSAIAVDERVGRDV